MKTHHIWLIIFFALLFSINTQAQMLTGHYGPGLFGMRSAHGFPTDFSYVNVTQLYYAGEMKDNNGKISTLAKPVNVIANVNGLAWGTSLPQINAKYNAAIVLPLTNLAPNPETLELDPHGIGLGDAMLIPAMLSWNFNRLAVNTRYAIWMPTGSYMEGAANNRGKGFWSHNVGLGATLYLDAAKLWSLSCMNTFEINTRQKDTQIRPGTNWVMEWSLGKTFDDAFNLGVIGFSNHQTGRQTGGNLPPDFKGYRTNGIGMETSYSIGGWAFVTRWYTEYLATNRPEGTIIRFMALKKF